MIDLLGWSVVFIATAFLISATLYALYLVVFLPLWVSVACYKVYKKTPNHPWDDDYKKSRFKLFKCYRWKDGIKYSGSTLRGELFTMNFTSLIPKLTIHEPTDTIIEHPTSN